MPSTHKARRTKVCLICFEKKTCRPITGENLNRVKKFFLPSYDPESDIFPTGVCDTDRKLLIDVSNGEADKSQLPQPKDFAEIVFPH